MFQDYFNFAYVLCKIYRIHMRIYSCRSIMRKKQPTNPPFNKQPHKQNYTNFDNPIKKKSKTTTAKRNQSKTQNLEKKNLPVI